MLVNSNKKLNELVDTLMDGLERERCCGAGKDRSFQKKIPFEQAEENLERIVKKMLEDGVLSERKIAEYVEMTVEQIRKNNK